MNDIMYIHNLYSGNKIYWKCKWYC